MNPVRSGLALAITVAAFYSLCTIAWLISPEQFLLFLNKLFHGISFNGMYSRQPFQWPAVGGTLFLWTVAAVAVGAFHA